MQSITVTIDSEGNAKIQVDGCAGSACEKLTEAVEKALGKVSSNQRTPDYFRPEIGVKVNAGT